MMGESYLGFSLMFLLNPLIQVINAVHYSSLNTGKSEVTKFTLYTPHP